MKVLVVCQHFHPENFRINDICFELSKKGEDVTVLTGLPNYPKGKVLKEYKWFKKRNEVINGVKIKRCSLIGRGTSNFSMLINYIWFTISSMIKVLFMKKDFDVVYVYQLTPITMAWPAILVKELKNIPLIIHCLDQWPISVTTVGVKKKSLIYKFLTYLSKQTYLAADLITTSSKSFVKYFENELGISKEEKGLLYYPSYAEDTYGNINYIEDNNFDLLFAGNIGPAQSVETIVEAANILKDKKNIKFHIVGDGLTRKSCEDLAISYGLDNITFYGYHDVSKMPDFYKLADAFLITMVDNEVVNNTLPAKVQSYMVAGRPIIGAISGEVKDVIKEADCGLCCESLDYKGLADIILEASLETKNIKKWSDNAKKYYNDNFKKENCINDLRKLFKKTKKKKVKSSKLIEFIKYTLSSGICMLFDLTLFSILIYILNVSNEIIIATAIARVFSIFLNFIINKNLVFRNSNEKALRKYLTLATVQLLISGILVQYISSFIAVFVIIIKFTVDVILFLINYMIQKKWVFKGGSA